MKPTDKTFSIGVDLVIPKLTKVKKYLHKDFDNRYNFPPHVGITITAIDPKYLENAFNYCKQYFKDIKSFRTKVSPLSYKVSDNNPLETFIDLKIVGPKLYKIHKETTIFLSDNYKGGYVREKDFERVKKGLVKGVKSKNIKKYGFAYCMGLYNPHITVGVLQTNILTPELKGRIKSDLKGIEGGEVEIKNIHIIYHTSPKVQTESKVIKRFDIVLP